MLRMAVPGNPEEDCQPFHVCSANRDGGLNKNSFLCPNGTLFNQENFVCEYWFNVDCSQAESSTDSMIILEQLK